MQGPELCLPIAAVLGLQAGTSTTSQVEGWLCQIFDYLSWEHFKQETLLAFRILVNKTHATYYLCYLRRKRSIML